MSKNQDILELIQQNYTVNEICSITGLSPKQLFYRLNMLKIKGYEFNKKYYYTGDIIYTLKKDIEKDANEATIITSKNDTEFKAVLISDLHFGNINERPDLLYEVYNFCAKEGINIIINIGDLLDGTCGNINYKKITDINKQIEYLLKNYPYDKNILNFICLGNHDYSCLTSSGIDLKKVLENKRHDLISLGYGFGKINIKNEQIIVTHPNTANIKIKQTNNKLILTGHSHKSKNIFAGASSHIFIPSLSNLSVYDISYDGDTLPGMIKTTFTFRNGYFNVSKFEHFIFVNNKMYKVSESQADLLPGKSYQNTFINNEEEKFNFNEESEKTYRLSQTEKFRQRYIIEKK